MTDDIISILTDLQSKANNLATLSVQKQSLQSDLRNQIRAKLQLIDATLVEKYDQIYRDLEDNSRLSWSGTAHEIRELLRLTLESLAPDSDVLSMPGYIQNEKTAGPTQKQRVQYIVKKNKHSSQEKELIMYVIEFDEMLESFLGNILRSTYSRASDAAHRSKAKKEAEKILRYFEAFLPDILDL